MRLASFMLDGVEHYGIIRDGSVLVISASLGSQHASLAELLGQSDFFDLCRQAAKISPLRDLDDIELLPPIPLPKKIFCVGLNYEDHRLETNHARTPYPTLFSRFADSQCGHGAGMLLPNCSEQFDYEAELAVVIGRPGSNISRENALDHVAGYSCYNDGSIRDWQVHSSQFLPGKNFPATGAFGPFLVTTDEIRDVQDLAIVCRLNGELVQSARTSDMIHCVADLIAYISRFTLLSSGDVIATGTPGGVGFTRNPALFMRQGDVVEVEIEHVGLLRNHVVQAPRTDLTTTKAA